MSTITMVSALSENQDAWVTTLVAGLVVLLVVIALLETLRRTVVNLNGDIWEMWVNGKAVVKNTAMNHWLKTRVTRATSSSTNAGATTGSGRNDP